LKAHAASVKDIAARLLAHRKIDRPGTCSNRDWPARDHCTRNLPRKTPSAFEPFDRDALVPLRAAPLRAPATIFAHDAAVLFEQAGIILREAVPKGTVPPIALAFRPAPFQSDRVRER